MRMAGQRKVAPDLDGKLSIALLGMWEFHQFIACIWVTVGTPCRAVLASLMTGLESLVHPIRNDPDTTDSYTHIFM